MNKKMIMQITPPIKERTTEQLIGILKTPDDWREGIVSQAEDELMKRGQDLEKIKDRIESKAQRQKKTQNEKAKASYSVTEKILIVLFAPVVMFIINDFFSFSKGDGYKKQNRQGLFYSFLGLFIWLAAAFIFLNLF